MRLLSVAVGPFRSVDTKIDVKIDPQVTALVGMNEAGKTVFLNALNKAADVLGIDKFDPVEDYPRKALPTYLKGHEKSPADVVSLTFVLTDDEVSALSETLKTTVPQGFKFTLTSRYNNTRSIDVAADERPAIVALATDARLSSDAATAIKSVKSIRSVPAALTATNLTDADKTVLQEIEQRIQAADGAGWNQVVAYEVSRWLEVRTPQFLYFGDYEVLPSKTNLQDLAAKAANPTQLTTEQRGVLALLRMADISLSELANPSGYEPLKAKIEAVSINLTDQILEFWKQNEDLEVEIDIKPDPTDQAPFNSGPNIYLRIKNRRHRGVSTPFKQRSRGFIWFFSFLVWFDDVKHQLAVAKTPERPLILLLDEPGLSLHALAQRDFLRYIDDLAAKHQVIYTTHSPFMIHAERLRQIRTVEDRKDVGTVISENLSSSDPRTIFPLQAALGWTIAQNLFISERNLLVEGPAELLYLKTLSAALEASGQEGLRDDITIVPAGGLDKVATFVALLGANGLKLAVFHDYRGAPEQRLVDLVKDKLISDKAILTASHYRDVSKLGIAGPPADTEDLLSTDEYLEYFNQAFAKALPKGEIKQASLPKGDRIVDRIERHLASKGIQMRPSGGFNHYLVALELSRNPPTTFESNTLTRFEALFKKVNQLLP